MRYCSVLQYVAMCCSVLFADVGGIQVGDLVQCVIAVCCSVLQCIAVCHCSLFQCFAVCCSVLQCVAVCCSVLQRDVYVCGRHPSQISGAVCCSLLLR